MGKRGKGDSDSKSDNVFEVAGKILIKEESDMIFINFAFSPLLLTGRKGGRGDSDSITDIIFEVVKKY